jgi:hypothetical protein
MIRKAALRDAFCALGVASLALLASCSSEQESGAVGTAMMAVVTGGDSVWHGAVTISEDASGSFILPQGMPGENTNQSSMSNRVTITVTENARASAKIDYSQRAASNGVEIYDWYTVTGTTEENGFANGLTDDAWVKVESYPDGSYELQYFAAGTDGKLTTTRTTQIRCHKQAGENCKNSDDTSQETIPLIGRGGASGTVEGRFDPDNPDVIRGSSSDPDFRISDDVRGMSTVTWRLERVRR